MPHRAGIRPMPMREKMVDNLNYFIDLDEIFEKREND